MRALGLLSLALLGAAGCGSTKSPCASLGTYSCIDATVRGNVGKLDELRVTIDFPKTASLLSPPTPMSIHLPVELGIALPPDTAGHEIRVVVEALLDGKTVATSAPWDEDAPAVGSPLAVTFELGGAASDGGTDGAIDASGPITLDPKTLAFSDTTVDRTSTAFFTVANTTTGSVAIGTPAFTGDTAFTTATAPASDPLACGQGAQQTLRAGSSCHAYVGFTPTKIGASTGTVSVTTTDGSATVSIGLQGNGIAPAYADETIAGAPTFLGVSGDSTGNIYVVGPASSDCAYAWSGTAWTDVCNGLTDRQLVSVTALDTAHVWVGAFAKGNGISGSSTQGATWMPDTLAPDAIGANESQIVAMLALSATDLYALVSTGSSGSGLVIRSTDGSSWAELASPISGSLKALATNGTEIMVAGDGGQVAFAPVDQSFGGPFTPMGIMPTTTIQGAWGAPGGSFYFVAQSDQGAWGIYSIGLVGNAATPVYVLTDNSVGLTGISGRVVASSGGAAGSANVELYAVGGLDKQIIHCTTPSGGTLGCALEPMQTDAAMNAVWVGADGEVVAVGASGAIAHLH